MRQKFFRRLSLSLLVAVVVAPGVNAPLLAAAAGPVDPSKGGAVDLNQWPPAAGGSVGGALVRVEVFDTSGNSITSDSVTLFQVSGPGTATATAFPNSYSNTDFLVNADIPGHYQLQARDTTAGVTLPWVTGVLFTDPSQPVGWYSRATNLPSTRLSAPLAYDSSRHVTVMAGGGGISISPYPGTWEWDGTAWTNRSYDAPLWGAVTAYDASRQVTVAFAPTNSSGPSGTTEWNGTSWNNRQPAHSPSSRHDAVMAYDPDGHRVLLFGGYGPTSGGTWGALSDTWAYDGTDWTLLSPAGTIPPRSRASVTYDTLHHELVVFGGLGVNGTALGDTWTLSSQGWHQVSLPLSPAPRAGAAMTFDGGALETVLYGGVTQSGDLSDTWVFNGSTWLELTPVVAPRARQAAFLAFDSVRNQDVLFGGDDIGALTLSSNTYGSAMNDTWEFSALTQRWTERTPLTKPPARTAYGLSFDASRRSTVLFGGDQFGLQGLNDTWEWDGAYWFERTPPHSPSARGSFGMAYDQAHHVDVLFGGRAVGAGAAALNETWTYDGIDWTPVHPATSPPPRSNFGMTYDSARGRIVIFGGNGGTAGSPVYLNDTWEWDGVNWSQRTTTTAPPARSGEGLTFDAARHVTTMFGGAGPTELGDTWQYDGSNWAELHPAMSPSPRTQPLIAFDSQHGLVTMFSGRGPGASTGRETWLWNGTNWTPADSWHFAPTDRTGGQMAYDSFSERFVLVGEEISNGTYGDSVLGVREETASGVGSEFKDGTPISTTPALADGVATVPVTLTIRDRGFSALPGKVISLRRLSGPGNPDSGTNQTTDSNGQVTFNVHSTTAGTDIMQAVDLTDGVVFGGAHLYQEDVAVTFLPTTVAPAVSDVVASPTLLAPDGTPSWVASVALKDPNGNPVPGKTATAVASGNATVQPLQPVSDVNGLAQFKVTDSTPEAVTITGTDLTDGRTLLRTATINFSNLPPSPSPSPSPAPSPSPSPSPSPAPSPSPSPTPTTSPGPSVPPGPPSSPGPSPGGGATANPSGSPSPSGGPSPTPGTAPSGATHSAFVALPPTRLLDTRPDGPRAGSCSGVCATIGPGQGLDVQVAGQGGVPARATAVVMNVTATRPTVGFSDRPNYLTVYPTGVSRPLASTLNFVAGATVPNLTQVQLGSGGRVTIYNNDGYTDVIADVVGYVLPGVPGTSGLYHALDPFRIGDTRAGSGLQGAGRPLGPEGTASFTVRGMGGVPSTHVSAVVLNVTVVNPTAGGPDNPNYLSVYPGGVSRPLASSLNFVGGQTVSNRVIVPLGSNPASDISIYNLAGQSDVVVDVGGWFSDGTDPNAGGSSFTPTSPIRLCDTRDTPGTAGATACAGGTLNSVGAGHVLSIRAAGNGAMPAMGSPGAPTAVVVDVAVTNTTAPSYLTAYPGPSYSPLPRVSDLNWSATDTRASLVVVRVGPDGTFNLYNYQGSTDVIVDVMGWYSSP